LGIRASGGSAQEPPRTIDLVTQHAGGFRVDNPPRGASAGDLFGFRETLISNGTRVGRGHGTCVAVTRTLSECSVSAILADGTIAVRLAQDFSKRESTAAVVGGTGAYRGARGQAAIRSGRRGNRIAIELVE